MRVVSKNKEDKHRYDDMLNLPVPKSKNHKHMSNAQRAAQFSSFDALNGYKESLQEEGRMVFEKACLAEDAKQSIDEQLITIQNRIQEKLLISITYFVKDSYKAGGHYETVTKRIKKLELGKLVFVDKTTIDICDIQEIEIINI